MIISKAEYIKIRTYFVPQSRNSYLIQPGSGRRASLRNNIMAAMNIGKIHYG